jgi:hypothetical protein
LKPNNKFEHIYEYNTQSVFVTYQHLAVKSICFLIEINGILLSALDLTVIEHFETNIFIVGTTYIGLNITWWFNSSISSTREHKTTLSDRPHLPGS